MTCPIWTPPSSFAADLRERYALTCPPQWGTPRRPEFPSFGGKVCKVMTALGTPPLPWQRYVLDVALEVDPVTGILCYRNVGLSVMRQQGKTTLMLGLMTHRMMAWAKQQIIYTCQTRGAARTRWEDEFLVTLESSRLANRFRARKTTGNEAILWKATRSKMGIISATEKAGHGPPLDLGVIDEAFAHEDDRLEQAMSPAMLTRIMAQLWWASAGGTEKSVYLNRKRESGRAQIEALFGGADPGGACYFEWFAPPELPRDRPETWHGCMPALCPNVTPPCTCDPAGVWHHTVTEPVIRSELNELEAPEFDRAYLNRTRKSVPPVDPNVPTKEWAGRAQLRSQAGENLTFAIDVTPTRDYASIGVFSVRDDGIGHVELVDRRPGVDWVRPALLRLRELWSPLAIGVDALGPAGALIDELEKAGLVQPPDPDRPLRGDLAVTNTRDVCVACGQFADAVRQGTLAHIDQTELNTALLGARTRTLTDAWAWARRHAAVDISPLVAVTLARWAHVTRVDLVLPLTYDVSESVY